MYRSNPSAKVHFFILAVMRSGVMVEALLRDSKLCPHLVLFFFFGWCCLLLPSAVSQNLLSCEAKSPDSLRFTCGGESQSHCGTFAVLRTNSYYSSLFNLSFYLGVNKIVVAQTNGFSADTEFLPLDQPLLIPIDCKCGGDGFFKAELTKTAVKGEGFYGIAQSLEGLTTCDAIRSANPGVSPLNLSEKVALRVPVSCACNVFDKSPDTSLLLSYPVKEGDSISTLALRFNTTVDAIILANNKPNGSFNPNVLTPFTTILVPFKGQPMLGSISKPSKPEKRIRRGKRKHMKPMWIYIMLSGVAVVVFIAIAAVLTVIQLKKRNLQSSNSFKKPGTIGDDLELQQLSLSVRTTSDKKVSFEGSQGGLETTPRKMTLEAFTIEELKKATDEFNPSNHIEGSVFHGRLGGKNLAVKRARPEFISKVEFFLFQDTTHKHPNLVRLLGTCLATEDGQDSFLVFEYAKNGSLKDWIHGGLAIKSHFIASCNCFLTWYQRLKICLDVAMALQYMHHIMSPSYIHKNIKSRNIFLDEEFNGKVGNFGMSGFSEDEKPNLSYLSPEYIYHGVVSPALDVYAYGIVLMEVLTGRAPVSGMSQDGEGLVWLREKVKSENMVELKEMMDRAMGENYPFDGAFQLVTLAVGCTEEDPSMRPNSGEVVEQLLRIVEEQTEGDYSLMSESSSKPLVKSAFAIQ